MCTGGRSERRRREGWDAEGAEWGGVWAPPQPTRGSGRASWAPPVGSGAKPLPQTHFLHILGHIFWRRTCRFRPSSLVGWGFGRVSSPSRLGGLEERREFPSGIRGETQAANAFYAYSRPQNASRRKKKYFQFSSAAWTTDPTIILSLSSPTGSNFLDWPPWLRQWTLV